MTFIKWNDALKIGLSGLDQEHRQLSQAINDLHASLTDQSMQARTGPLLQQMVESTRAHFAGEEAMMERNKYPGMALHVLKHQHLLQQVDALKGRFHRGGFTLNEYSLTFLRDWFTVHVQNDDRNFVVWLREHAGRQASQQ